MNNRVFFLFAISVVLISYLFFDAKSSGDTGSSTYEETKELDLRARESDDKTPIAASLGVSVYQNVGEITDSGAEDLEAKLAFGHLLSLLEGEGSTGGLVHFRTRSEYEEYSRWLESIGEFVEPPNQSGYETYDSEALYNLAKRGDLRAYEALRSTPLTIDQLKAVLDVGVVAGSNPAIYGMARHVNAKAKSILDDGDADGYKQLFTDQLALLEIYEMRGGFLPDQSRERLLNSYRLDDVEDVLSAAKTRAPELIDEINRQRSDLALEPLDFELPDVVVKAQEMQACQSNRQCLANYVSPELL